MLNLRQLLSLFTLFVFCQVNSVVADDPLPKLEFRIADDAETQDWKKMELPGSDKTIFVSSEATVNGGHIEKVSFYKDANGNPSIGISLTVEGAKAMKATTSQNQKKKLAIVLDGKVFSAPVIRSTITNELQISGHFEEDDLLKFFRAIVLRDVN